MPLKAINPAVTRRDREFRFLTDFGASDDGAIIEGYAVVFEQPTVLFEEGGIEYKEMIARSALNQADMSDVILNYNHAGKVLARTRNGTLQLSIDDRGLFVRADLSGTEAGRQLYEEVKGGYIDRMSFSFTVAESEYDRAEHMRIITRIKKLYDVSAVDIPAYDTTYLSARSAVMVFENKIRAEKRKRLELLMRLAR